MKLKCDPVQISLNIKMDEFKMWPNAILSESEKTEKYH